MHFERVLMPVVMRSVGSASQRCDVVRGGLLPGRQRRILLVSVGPDGRTAEGGSSRQVRGAVRAITTTRSGRARASTSLVAPRSSSFVRGIRSDC